MTAVPLFTRKKMGTHPLSKGKKGGDVTQLQTLLDGLGYNTGDERGVFGYLTQGALRDFQREYGLTIDGIAGPEVFSLLAQQRLPVTRRVHLVQNGERIAEIAKKYDLGVEAFQHSNRIDPIYPGQSLVFFDREVWGKVLSLTDPASHELTGTIFSLNLNQEIGAQSIPNHPVKIASLELDAEDQMVCLHRVLKGRKLRKATITWIEELAKRVDGIWFPWTAISRVDGGRYVKFLATLRKRLPPEKKIFVSLNNLMPRRNLLGGIDFGELGQLVDRVVVPVPIPHESNAFLTKEKVESTIWSMSKSVYSWKIILQLPVWSVQWKVTEPAETTLLSYSQVMNYIYKSGARTHKDQKGHSYHRYFAHQEEYHIRVVNRDRLSPLLGSINSWHLAGVLIDSIGAEDPRLWEVLYSNFRPACFS